MMFHWNLEGHNRCYINYDADNEKESLTKLVFTYIKLNRICITLQSKFFNSWSTTSSHIKTEPFRCFVKCLAYSVIYCSPKLCVLTKLMRKNYNVVPSYTEETNSFKL